MNFWAENNKKNVINNTLTFKTTFADNIFLKKKLNNNRRNTGRTMNAVCFAPRETASGIVDRINNSFLFSFINKVTKKTQLRINAATNKSP